MNPDGLSRLGLTKIQGELYSYTKAENGDIARAYIPHFVSLFSTSLTYWIMRFLISGSSGSGQ
jgi:hypothetical protein